MAHVLRLAGVAALVVAVPGCGGGESDGPPFPPGTVAAVSTAQAPEGAGTVETRPRPPQVPGIPERASAATFRLQPIARDLTEPVYVAAAPGEPRRLYVVERQGRILVLEDGELARTPFLDIREQVRAEVEEGLHSMAFHPDYAASRRLFVAYNDRRGDLRVVEYLAEGGRADPASAREVLAIDKTEGVQWHNGGQLQFGPDGRLYVSTGDSARNPYDGLADPPSTPDPDNNAQNLGLLFGKLIGVDVDEREPRPEPVGYGLRNAWRFSFDRETGDLYIGDVGQFAREEVDYVPASEVGELANFGWSVFEGETVFNGGHALSAAGRVVWPIVSYEHPPDQLYCTNVRGTVVGGYVYRGEAIPALRGRYVFGDWCSGEVWTVRVQDGRAADVRKERATLPGIVSFGEDADGELFAVSILDGSVHRLAPPTGGS